MLISKFKQKYFYIHHARFPDVIVTALRGDNNDKGDTKNWSEFTKFYNLIKVASLILFSTIRF